MIVSGMHTDCTFSFPCLKFVNTSYAQFYAAISWHRVMTWCSLLFPINRLLTPPETPLFRSLDDDDQSVTQVSRGRAQTKPKQISRSSTVSAYVQRSFF